MNTFVIDTFKTSFDLEIFNRIEVTNNKIVVSLADGTKAIIKTKDVA